MLGNERVSPERSRELALQAPMPVAPPVAHQQPVVIMDAASVQSVSQNFTELESLRQRHAHEKDKLLSKHRDEESRLLALQLQQQEREAMMQQQQLALEQQRRNEEAQRAARRQQLEAQQQQQQNLVAVPALVLLNPQGQAGGVNQGIVTGASLAAPLQSGGALQPAAGTLASPRGGPVGMPVWNGDFPGKWSGCPQYDLRGEKHGSYAPYHTVIGAAINPEMMAEVLKPGPTLYQSGNIRQTEDWSRKYFTDRERDIEGEREARRLQHRYGRPEPRVHYADPPGSMSSKRPGHSPIRRRPQTGYYGGSSPTRPTGTNRPPSGDWGAGNTRPGAYQSAAANRPKPDTAKSPNTYGRPTSPRPQSARPQSSRPPPQVPPSQYTPVRPPPGSAPPPPAYLSKTPASQRPPGPPPVGSVSKSSPRPMATPYGGKVPGPPGSRP